MTHAHSSQVIADIVVDFMQSYSRRRHWKASSWTVAKVEQLFSEPRVVLTRPTPNDHDHDGDNKEPNEAQQGGGGLNEFTQSGRSLVF